MDNNLLTDKMRSIFIHLAETTREDVAVFLSRMFPGQAQPWLHPVPPKDNALYIDFSEPEPEDMPEIFSILGNQPFVSLVANVSGRHPGDQEVAYFIQLCLTAFKGVAQDDYSAHAWTLLEIQEGQQHQGHRFFDYLGWYEEMKANKDSQQSAGGEGKPRHSHNIL